MKFARIVVAYLGLVINNNSKLLSGDALAVIEINFNYL